jgi:hypothetical protein
MKLWIGIGILLVLVGLLFFVHVIQHGLVAALIVWAIALCGCGLIGVAAWCIATSDDES